MAEFYLAPTTLSAHGWSGRLPFRRGARRRAATKTPRLGMPGQPPSFTLDGYEARTHRRKPVTLPPLVEPAADLTVDEVKRYSRHLIIPDVGMTGQKRLKNAKVLCVGAGGLGSPALLYLAAAGVGTLGVIDFDVVDESNLQRQIIHGQSDVGRLKALSARDSIKEVNPYVDVVVHAEALTNDNVMEIFSGYDLIVDGTDNFATRYMVNDACVLLGKPYVWGSIYRFDGQASVFWAEYGPCYRCLYPEPPPPGMVPSCAEGGVLGVLCASIGSIQVNEAIKLLTGIGEPLVGRLMVYDALEMSYRSLNIKKDPDCPICGKNPTITELIDYDAFCGVVSADAQEAAAGSTITAAELKEMLDRKDDIFLIDVREPNEYEIVSIPGSVLIPKEQFLNGSALERLPQDRRIILHCKSGVRSAECLAVVKNAGFSDAVHLGGGVLSWVNTVDPSLPVY
jgi:adenylyltransferase/sulfurtransferase